MAGTYTFYKIKNTWFIYFPQYVNSGGASGELAMMNGSDKLFKIFAKDESIITLSFYNSQWECKTAHMLEVFKLSDSFIGSYYEVKSNGGKILFPRLWLCDVILFVFANFPEKIYIKKERTTSELSPIEYKQLLLYCKEKDTADDAGASIKIRN
jgi:hypothetical protein